SPPRQNQNRPEQRRGRVPARLPQILARRLTSTASRSSRCAPSKAANVGISALLATLVDGRLISGRTWRQAAAARALRHVARGSLTPHRSVDSVKSLIAPRAAARRAVGARGAATR